MFEMKDVSLWKSVVSPMMFPGKIRSGARILIPTNPAKYNRTQKML